MKFTKLQMLFIRNIWSEERLIKIYKKHYCSMCMSEEKILRFVASILLNQIVLPLNLLTPNKLEELLLDRLDPNSFYNSMFKDQVFDYNSNLFNFIAGLIGTTERAKFGEDMVWPLRVRKM